MTRSFIAASLLALSVTATTAASGTDQGKPDPTQQALVQMLSEAQSREAQALVQVWSLRAEVEDLRAQVASATRRADEAEAKLKTTGEATK